jgi:hypothetical protein
MRGSPEENIDVGDDGTQDGEGSQIRPPYRDHESVDEEGVGECIHHSLFIRDT